MNPNQTPEELYNERYPQKDYSKTEYNFTAEEISKLQSLDSISQLGQMAQITIDRYVQSDLLKDWELKTLLM